MYVHVHVHVHVHVCVCVWCILCNMYTLLFWKTRLIKCAHVVMYICVSTCTQLYVCVHVHVHNYVHTPYIYLKNQERWDKHNNYTYMYMCMCRSEQIYISEYMYICNCMYTRVHVNDCIQYYTLLVILEVIIQERWIKYKYADTYTHPSVILSFLLISAFLSTKTSQQNMWPSEADKWRDDRPSELLIRSTSHPCLWKYNNK